MIDDKRLDRIVTALERIANALEKANVPVVINTDRPQTLVGEWSLDLEAIRRLIKLAQAEPGDESREEKPCFCIECNRHGMSKSNQCPHCNAELKGM